MKIGTRTRRGSRM